MVSRSQLWDWEECQLCANGCRGSALAELPTDSVCGCLRPLLGEGPDSCAAAVHALEADLDTASSCQVAALLIEVVQGPNGHSVFEREYYAGIQRVCRNAASC